MSCIYVTNVIQFSKTLPNLNLNLLNTRLNIFLSNNTNIYLDLFLNIQIFPYQI